jgi:rhomboid protease GluP
MDYDIVIFWIVCFSCLAGAIVAWRRMRFAARGWIALYLSVLLLAVAGSWLDRPLMIRSAAAIWFVFLVLPGLIGKLYYRRFVQQNYASARRLARIISWLHPADDWTKVPEIIHALELAQQGNIAAATEVLERYQDVKSQIGLMAMVNYYRITNQWEELLPWLARHCQGVEQYSQILPIELRARGETGDIRGLVELYDRCREQIGKIVPESSRDTCRLMLFAFCGQRQSVEDLCNGRLAVLPAAVRAFWLATADLAAGQSEAARQQLEALLPAADPPMRAAIERRLARISLPREPLDAAAMQVLEDAAVEHVHEERFAGQRTLFSHKALATQILIALNVLMFFVEVYRGGSTNGFVLYDLGALFPPTVREDHQWWRLIAALFLHYGELHLAMNMIALWILGPFVEFALGLRRFVLVYLLAGIGSMATVMAFSSPAHEHFTVGASGCIMGLVGATAALMLKGWLRERALAAQRRLVAVLLIVAMQTVFDSLVPQVSMTAHLSGACIGFVATLFLRDRLRQPAAA